MQTYWDKFKFYIITGILYIIIYLSNLTLNIKIEGKENLDQDSPRIFSVWHRYIWVIMYYFRNPQKYTLASLSEDGAYITAILEKMGWEVVRGSSTRGGARSLIKLYRLMQSEKAGSVVLTPDGPTGPCCKVKPGIIYLQEKTGGCIIPIGLAVSRKKVLDSWDNFIVPYPWARVVMVIGEPLQLNSDMEVDRRCELVERKMKQVRKQAQNILKNRD